MHKNTHFRRSFLGMVILLSSLLLLFKLTPNASKAGESKKAHTTETTVVQTPTQQASLDRLTAKLEQTLLENSTTPIHTNDLKMQVHTWFQQEFYAQNDRSKMNETEATHHLTLQSLPFSETVFQLLFTKDAFTSGFKQTTQFKTVTFDPQTQTILHLDDFILNDRQNRETLKTLLRNEEPKESTLDEELLEKALLDFEKINWTFSKKGLTFYWAANELAEESLQLELPFAKLEGLAVTERLEAYLPEKKVEPVAVLSKQKLDPNGKYVALTFDDGPDPETTPLVLDILREQQIVGTFYLLGSRVPYSPELVEEMVAQGHELGNHTYDHLNVAATDYATLASEIERTNAAIYEASGAYPKTIRTPYGAMSAVAESVATAYRMPIVMWSVDSRDWESRNPVAIHEVVMRLVGPGSIILLHDVHDTTVQALPRLIASLKQQGYEFVTVTQILAWEKASGVGPHYGEGKTEF